jgi:hypothetical protein
MHGWQLSPVDGRAATMIQPPPAETHGVPGDSRWEMSKIFGNQRQNGYNGPLGFLVEPKA